MPGCRQTETASGGLSPEGCFLFVFSQSCRSGVALRTNEMKRNVMKYLMLVLALVMGGGTSMVVGADLSRGFLLVANKGEHTLGIIDTAARKPIATVDE